MTLSYVDLIGVPFVYGGRRNDALDCYGLVLTLHRRAGIELPDYLSPTDQPVIAAMMATQLSLWSDCPCERGAVVMFRIKGLISHVGVVIDRSSFVHCIEGVGVAVERLDHWNKRVIGCYEFTADSLRKKLKN